MVPRGQWWGAQEGLQMGVMTCLQESDGGPIVPEFHTLKGQVCCR